MSNKCTHVNAIVARSTFPSQNVQSTPGSDYFCKLRCRKSGHGCGTKHIFKSKCAKLRCRKSERRCGAKHISKSKCMKQTRLGPLLEVEMSNKCTHVHAIVARRTFPSQNVQSTPGSDYNFCKLRCRKSGNGCGTKHIFKSKCTKLRCRKSARCCRAKHISKSKCTKQTMFGPLLKVAMSIKCTPLWREAHFQVKMYKTNHVRTTFKSCHVDQMHAIVARSIFPNQNVQKRPFSDHFWKLRCGKSARHCGAKHNFKSKCTKHTGFGPLFEVQMSKNRTPL